MRRLRRLSLYLFLHEIEPLFNKIEIARHLDCRLFLRGIKLHEPGKIRPRSRSQIHKAVYFLILKFDRTQEVVYLRIKAAHALKGQTGTEPLLTSSIIITSRSRKTKAKSFCILYKKISRFQPPLTIY